MLLAFLNLTAQHFTILATIALLALVFILVRRAIFMLADWFVNRYDD